MGCVCAKPVGMVLAAIDVLVLVTVMEMVSVAMEPAPAPRDGKVPTALREITRRPFIVLFIALMTAPTSALLSTKAMG